MDLGFKKLLEHVSRSCFLATKLFILELCQGQTVDAEVVQIAPQSHSR